MITSSRSKKITNQTDDDFTPGLGGKLAFGLALAGVIVIAILTIRYNLKYTIAKPEANVFNLFAKAFKKLELPK